MTAIVRLALRMPYTPVVLAILITLFGGLAAVQHTDRHLSRHQNPGHRRRVDLSRTVARRHGRPCHLLLRAADLDGRQRHRTYRKPVADRHRHRQNLFPPRRRHPHRDRASRIDVADGPQADAARHHAAAGSQLQRIDGPDHPARAFEHEAARTEAVRFGTELHSSVACDRPGFGGALSLWRQGTADPDRPRSAGAAGQGPLRRRRRERASPRRTRSFLPARRRSASSNTT